jgi:hypothetical protein
MLVNGVFDGTQTDIDRWITYGTQTTNTFSVQRPTAQATARR